jgi:hypothetical protein
VIAYKANLNIISSWSAEVYDTDNHFKFAVPSEKTFNLEALEQFNSLINFQPPDFTTFRAM